MLPRSPLGALQFGGGAEDESESLQADVMRFMAILGLCLMVIFALVQSLPSVGETREKVREREAERAAHTVEIAELRQQVRIISRDNVQFQAQLLQRENTDAELRDANEDTLKLQMQLQQYERTIETQNLQLQQNEVVEDRILELNQQQQQSQMALRRTELRLEEQQAIVQAQSSEIAALQSRLAVTPSDQIVQETQAEPIVESKPEPQTQFRSDSEPAPDSVPPIPEPTQAEGFRLTFESNDAFFSLVQSGEIDVFVITPQNEGYQLARNGRELLASPLPSQVQDINKASLPPVLVDVLSRQRLPQSSRWGVVLSSQVMQGIDRARDGARGGTLSIDGAAGVKLK